MIFHNLDLAPELERFRQLGPEYESTDSVYLALLGDDAGSAALRNAVNPSIGTLIGHWDGADRNYRFYPDIVSPDRRQEVGRTVLGARQMCYKRRGSELLNVDNPDTATLIRSQRRQLDGLRLLEVAARHVCAKPFDEYVSIEVGALDNGQRDKRRVILRARGIVNLDTQRRSLGCLPVGLGVAHLDEQRHLSTFKPAEGIPGKEVEQVTGVVEELLRFSKDHGLNPDRLNKR